MPRRLTLLLLALAVACDGSTSANGPALRFLAVTPAGTTAVRLIEFEAPPLRERRSLTLSTPDTTRVVLARADRRGGFYAVQFAGQWPAVDTWELLRYDADWQVVARRSAVEIAPGINPNTAFRARLTADGQHLLLAVGALQSSPAIATLDPRTLAVEHRSAHPFTFIGSGIPDATSGAELVLLAPAGDGAVWQDALSGQLVDSVRIPAAGRVYGARTHRELYWLPSGGPGSDTLELYDVLTGDVLARTAGRFGGAALWAGPSPSRLLVDAYWEAVVLDATTLGELGRLDLTLAGTARFWGGAPLVPDPAVPSMIIPTSAINLTPNPVGPPPDGLAIVDIERPAIVLNKVVGYTIRLVP